MKKFYFLLTCLLPVFVHSQMTVTVGPYLQSPTPSSIKILWRTDLLCASKIVYGTDLANLNLSVTDTMPVTKHAVQLTNLAPYTKYFYAVYSGSVFLEGADSTHWFRTFPIAGTNLPFRAWVIGDFGKANEKQKNVRDAYVNFDSVETNLWLWLGDNVYDDGTEAEYLTKVFDSINGYRNVMKHWPFLPCPGNHDYNSVSPVVSPVSPLSQTGPYLDFVDVYKNGEAGGVPTGHELFYSYDYGNAHFISMNSELGSLFNASDDWNGVSPFFTFTSSPFTTWLAQDLQQNTKPWVIAYFHQPPYTAGSHDSGTWWEVYMKSMRERFTPILEQYGVDLVLCGHSHVYERSMLVRGLYSDVSSFNPSMILQNRSGVDALGEAYTKYTQGANANRGTVYVVNGNSGSNDSSPPFDHPYMFSEYGCDTCCGSFVLDIDSNRLDGRHIDMGGVERDHFTIYKIDAVAPSGVGEINGDWISELKIKPNPFSGSTQLSFELAKNETIKIQLIDVTGKTVEIFSGNLTKGNHSYEIDAKKLSLAKGIYVVEMTGAGETLAKKILHIE